MRSLLGTVILVVDFSFQYFKYILPFPSDLQSFCWKISCWAYELSLVCYLLLLPCCFNVFSLCLVFISWISICLGMFLLGFILYGHLCASWTWLTISFSLLGKFSTIISSKIFSYPFFFSSSGTPIIQMLVRLILSQRSLRLPAVLFILSTLFCSSEVISTILSSSPLIRSSASDILLLISF